MKNLCAWCKRILNEAETGRPVDAEGQDGLPPLEAESHGICRGCYMRELGADPMQLRREEAMTLAGARAGEIIASMRRPGNEQGQA